MEATSIRSLASLLVIVLVALRAGALDAQGRDKDGYECSSVAKHGPWDTSTDTNSLTVVGYYFRDGDCGYPRDGFRAVQAWRRAAILARGENNLQTAGDNAARIAGCFYDGPCPRNLVEVYAWVNLSLAFREHPTQREIRELLERKLSARSVEQAQSRTQEILLLLDEESIPRAPKERRQDSPEATYGTAFFVSSDGHAVTNSHVIEACRVVKVGGETASVIAVDASADLALLRAGPKRQHFATFRDGGGVTAGASVVVVGYPLPGLLASADPNVTNGVVSALAGPSENRRYYQVTAPIQPGNSGGPLLDASGHVIGVVVSTLSTVSVANATGAIPQNLNFAIKAPAVRAMLESNEVPFQTARSVREFDVSATAARARLFTEQVECTK